MTRPLDKALTPEELDELERGANGEIKLYAPMDSMLELIAEVRRLRAENSCLRMDVIQLLPQKDED
jgi:hypothetical protein